MVKLFVDGQALEVPAGTNLLHAVLSHELDLPYFCWHPELGSVGACRQCAVVMYRDENDTVGRLTMACMTQVADNMRISLAAKNGVEFRAGIVEYLMRNHPHDCPVCEEGGECHLQDMTVMTGHTQRRTTAKKRTFRNQYLGPLLNHEMNRCITCYRCVRFYRDYAGGTDLQAMGSRDRTYFGRVEEGVLDNVFAGNLVEVCPTGVFTDKPFSKFYTRKWDLQSAPSVCNNCAVGCNISTSERYGLLKRVHNRYHSEVNGYFLCDRGRFGFHYINDDEQRLRLAGSRNAGGAYDPISVQSAVSVLVEAARGGKTIGIGSPRASLEANHLLRTLVGEANYCSGLAESEQTLNEFILQSMHDGAAHTPTLAEIEQADAVLVLGEDVLQTAPRIALAIRQATRNVTFELGKQAAIPSWADAGIRSHGRTAKSPLFAANVLPTDDADIATATYHGAPEDLAALGASIAQRLSGKAGVTALDQNDFVEAAATALAKAKKPLIVSGTSLGELSVLRAARAIADAIRVQGVEPALCWVVPECNSLGATLQGGRSVDAALSAVEKGEVDTVVVVENDLYRRADPRRVRSALGKVKVIALDSIVTEVVENANTVIPAAAFAECEGTFVNYETRAQRFYQAFQPKAPIAPAWRWMADATAQLGRGEFQHVDDVIASMEQTTALRGVANAAPAATFRANAAVDVDRKLPRQTHRFSGRTAMLANVSIHEPRQPIDSESPLAFSMEGTLDRASPILPYVWSPGWNSNQAITRFQKEAGGELLGGNGGVRLIAGGVRMSLPASAMSAANASSSANGPSLRAVPLYQVFGTDELSARAAPIVERAARPSVVLHPDDAKRLGFAEGDDVLVFAAAASGSDAPSDTDVARVRLRLNSAMRAGFVGYPRGGVKGVPTQLVVQADRGAARLIARQPS